MSDDLPRQLAFIAGDLERRHYPYVGVLRQAARALLEAPLPEPADPPGPPDRCRRCGTALVQKATGRPRVWCSDRCRKGRTPDETRR